MKREKEKSILIIFIYSIIIFFDSFVRSIFTILGWSFVSIDMSGGRDWIVRDGSVLANNSGFILQTNLLPLLPSSMGQYKSYGSLKDAAGIVILLMG